MVRVNRPGAAVLHRRRLRQRVHQGPGAASRGSVGVGHGGVAGGRRIADAGHVESELAQAGCGARGEIRDAGAVADADLNLAGRRSGQAAGPLLVGLDHLPQDVILGLLREQPVGVGRVLDGRHGDERHVPGVQVLQRLRQAEQPGDRSEPGVHGERLGGGVGDFQQLGRVVNGALALQLLDQRGDELLLQLDPAQVTAVADAVPGADEGQRLVPGDQVLTAGNLQLAEGVVVPAGRHADLDSAQRVHHGAEGVEVELDEVVDRRVRQQLDGSDRAGRAALIHRAVDDRVGDGRPVHATRLPRGARGPGLAAFHRRPPRCPAPRRCPAMAD